MGAHVSITPNHQLNRITPLKTRGDVAAFGAFGYELDLARLTAEERELVREQVRFVKKYRKLIHTGTFYRLLSPFDGNFTAWMVVSADRRQALVAYFKLLNDVNREYRRLFLHGLDESLLYRMTEDHVEKGSFYGSELMNIGMITTDASAGRCLREKNPAVISGRESLCWRRKTDEKENLQKQKRIAMSFFGVIVTGFCIGAFQKAGLGADPFTCFVTGIANLFHSTYGTFYMIVTGALLIGVFFAENTISASPP